MSPGLLGGAGDVFSLAAASLSKEEKPRKSGVAGVKRGQGGVKPPPTELSLIRLRTVRGSPPRPAWLSQAEHSQAECRRFDPAHPLKKSQRGKEGVRPERRRA